MRTLCLDYIGRWLTSKEESRIVICAATQYNRRMKQMLPFTKMHGLGNDFVVVDARVMQIDDWPELARALCDRHLGIGADQLLLVCDSTRADVLMRLFNTDGLEAEMCGNGIRCIGKYAYERGIVRKPELCIETLGGMKRLKLIIEDSQVTGAEVAMGVPEIIFENEIIDVGADSCPPLQLMGISMGNPHAVAFSNSPLAEFPLEQVGPLVERHPRFPNRTNFEIVNVMPDGSSLAVRVWERSAGITLACGTGACAATVAAHLKGLVGDEVEAHLPGGTLAIRWDGESEVFMTGPATKVFEGAYVVNNER